MEKVSDTPPGSYELQINLFLQKHWSDILSVDNDLSFTTFYSDELLKLNKES